MDLEVDGLTESILGCLSLGRKGYIFMRICIILFPRKRRECFWNIWEEGYRYMQDNQGLDCSSRGPSVLLRL